MEPGSEIHHDDRSPVPTPTPGRIRFRRTFSFPGSRGGAGGFTGAFQRLAVGACCLVGSLSALAEVVRSRICGHPAFGNGAGRAELARCSSLRDPEEPRLGLCPRNSAPSRRETSELRDYSVQSRLLRGATWPTGGSTSTSLPGNP